MAHGKRLAPVAPTLRLYSDGLCAPRNPGGYACFGWLALDQDNEAIAGGIGCVAHGREATCNVAEYAGVLAALAWAIENGQTNVVLYTDSMLVVKQVHGTWDCHKPHLLPLVTQAQERLAAVGGHIKWLPRERNTRADELSRLAYAEALKDKD